MTSALQYDVSNIFIHLGLDYQQSQPYQPPEQENNSNDEEDPDEGEQDSDEED